MAEEKIQKKSSLLSRRNIILAVILVLVVRTIWLYPRTNWSVKDKGHNLPQEGVRQVEIAPESIRHIVLISIDTCRADHLGCYGYSRNTSPNLDALANQSVLFNHAISPVPITLPSHSSMLTGTIPPYHGVRDNIDYQLAESNITLGEILKENGFVTGSVIGAFVMNSRFGLNQGFDTYNDKITGQGKGVTNHPERKAEKVSYLANQWLEKHYRDKFFLFLHYFDPHDPYVMHDEFAFSSFSLFAVRNDKYDSEIAYTDYHIGRVISKLKELGIYDSTLLIVTADHGEGLLDHSELSHSFFIYHSTIHVPLIIKVPGLSQGRIINDLVGLIDIVPTVCSLLGIQYPSQVQGKDLSAYLRGPQLPDADRYLYCESLVPTMYDAAPLVGVVSDRWKYIRTTRPELYDLISDPSETSDLIKKQPAQAEILHDQLGQILKMAVKKGGSESSMILDKETLKTLESLGYVGGIKNENLDFKEPKFDPKDSIDFATSFNDYRLLMVDKKYDQAMKLRAKLIEQRPRTVETLFKKYEK